MSELAKVKYNNFQFAGQDAIDIQGASNADSSLVAEHNASYIKQTTLYLGSVWWKNIYGWRLRNSGTVFFIDHEDHGNSYSVFIVAGKDSPADYNGEWLSANPAWTNPENLTANNNSSFPIPFVSLSNDYVQAGERWTILQAITLQGEIIGCSKSDLVARQNELLDAFSQDFKTIEISGLDDIELARVVSVDFQGSDYLSAISYTIELEAYSYDTFIDSNYVIEPVDSISIVENGDKTIDITHTISAKGVNSSSYNALTNAKNFVLEKLDSQKSEGTWPVPNLISSKDPNFKRMLVSVSEDIDRIQGRYSITKQYKSDLDYEDGSIILRHTKETTEQEGQFKIFTINGTIDGGIDSSLDFNKLRTRLKNFKKSLNTEFIHEFVDSASISEDVEAGRINFTFTFSSNPLEVIDDYDISISENSDTALISVSVRGTMSAKGPIGNVEGVDCRYNLVKSTFNENKYYDLAVKFYKDYLSRRGITVPDNVILNNSHLAKTVTRNEFEGSIGYDFSFDDRISHGYRNFDYTMDFTPSLVGIAADAIVDGGHAFYDLGYRKRAEFKINGASVGDGDSLSDFAERKYRTFCGGSDVQKKFIDEIVTEDSVTEDLENNSTFNYGWSFHSPNYALDPTESYTLPAEGDASLLL